MNVRSIVRRSRWLWHYIWTKFGIEHKYHTINTPPSWIFRLCEKKNVNNSGLDKDICITFYGIMHWTSAYTTACTTLQAVFTASTVVQAVLTVWTVVSCSNNFSTKHGTVVAGWATEAPRKLCRPRTPYLVLRTLNKRNSYRNVIKLQI